MAPHDIDGLARLCQASITELSDHSFDPAMRDWLLHQASCLSISVEILGLYTEREFSVVHRLSDEESQGLAMMFSQQLQALRCELRILHREFPGEETDVIGARPLNAIEDRSRNGSATLSSSDNHDDDHDGKINENNRISNDNCVDTIARRKQTIEVRLRLVRIATILMHREVEAYSQARARDFVPVGEDGVELESEFLNFIDQKMRRTFNVTQGLPAGETAVPVRADTTTQRDPASQRHQVPDCLRKRLRVTMLNRWR
jgi:hypothetical protein